MHKLLAMAAAAVLAAWPAAGVTLLDPPAGARAPAERALPGLPAAPAWAATGRWTLVPAPRRPREILPAFWTFPALRAARLDLAVLEGRAGAAAALPALGQLRAGVAPARPGAAPASKPALVSPAEIAAWRAAKGAPAGDRLRTVVLPDASPVPLPPGALLLPAALGALAALRRRRA